MVSFPERSLYIKPLRFLTLALTAFMSIAGYGQIKTVVPPEASHVTVEVMDQPGSPLRLEVLGVDNYPLNPPDKAHPKLLNTIRMRVDNIDGRFVRGYAIVFQSEKTTNVSPTVLVRLLERGRSNTFPTSSRAEWPSRVLVSVDYVEFADGTSWGNDTYKQSQAIGRFLEGRNLAVSRLNEILLNYPDAEFHRKKINAFIGSGLPGILPVPSPNILQTAFDFGYDSVLKGLRTPGKNTAESQEIARKIELMQQPQ